MYTAFLNCEDTTGVIIITDTLVGPGGLGKVLEPIMALFQVLFCPNIIQCMIFVSGLGAGCGKHSPLCSVL